MRVRKDLMPKRLSDLLGCTFLLVAFQLYYWFQLFVVFPAFYTSGSLTYALHFIFSTYLLVSVVGNFVALFLVDPSIRGVLLLAPAEASEGWRFCSVCETRAPPRSWHCSVCDTCILKRDHHCLFAATCVGHDNQRYFLMFLFFLTLATLYCSAHNVLFLWSTTHFTLGGFLKILFPVAILVFGADLSFEQFYRALCVISIIGAGVALVLFIYHLRIALSGQVVQEKAKNIRKYDLGSKLDNLRVILGKRWHLTWLLPFIKSEPVFDGVHWDKFMEESNKMK